MNERIIECAGHEIKVRKTMPQRWVVYLDGEWVLWACNARDVDKKIREIADTLM